MADTPSSAVAAYGEGVKWLIGLSGAAVAGAFLHFDQLSEQTIYVRLPVVLALGLFMFSIWSGVYYLLWLNSVAVEKERKREITEELKGADAARTSALNTRLEKAEKRIEAGDDAMPSWHLAYTRSFGAALIVSGLVLTLTLALSQKPRATNPESKACGAYVPEANHFVVNYSAIHQTGHGKEANTFLLDQRTGDLWQMTCRPNNEVAFRHVERLNSAATPTK